MKKTLKVNRTVSWPTGSVESSTKPGEMRKGVLCESWYVLASWMLFLKRSCTVQRPRWESFSQFFFVQDRTNRFLCTFFQLVKALQDGLHWKEFGPRRAKQKVRWMLGEVNANANALRVRSYCHWKKWVIQCFETWKHSAESGRGSGICSTSMYSVDRLLKRVCGRLPVATLFHFSIQSVCHVDCRTYLLLRNLGSFSALAFKTIPSKLVIAWASGITLNTVQFVTAKTQEDDYEEHRNMNRYTSWHFCSHWGSFIYHRVHVADNRSS